MFNRLKKTLTCIIAISLGVTACGNNKEDISNKINTASKHISSESVASDSDLVGAENADTVIKVPDIEGSSKEISIRSKKITLYTIENEQVVPKTSMVMEDMELKPESVIESVMLELDDLIPDDLNWEVIEEGDSVIVDFTVADKEYPFGKKNQVQETKVLECISYSVLDNFKDYKKVYFKLNGEAYISKQLKLSDKKPFMADE